MRTATMLLAVVVVLVAAPAWADFEAGAEAYVRGDYTIALKEWRPLAEQGNATAQSILGLLYENGQGVPRDYAEAMRWYRLAAEQGDAGAQTSLGVMYYRGTGVPQDDAEAIRWFRRAAEQGDADGQAKMGAMYAKGQGVPQNDVRAHMWWSLAAAQGHEPARKVRNKLAKRMTPAQLDEAQRLAREWKLTGK